ncbi:FG-GAP repeat protein, partial [Streptosporangium algeriense]
MVGVTPAPVWAATPCAVADPYSHREVTPADVGGGAATAGARFGSVVVSGDFDKDGFADVAVGAPNDSVGGAAAGSVSVFKGSAARCYIPGVYRNAPRSGMRTSVSR